jgi:chaperonin GroES
MNETLNGYQVFFDRVLVKPMDPPEKTKGGLFIPVASLGKLRWGKIVGTGTETYPDGNKHVCPVAIGDEVFYNPFAGTEVEIDGQTYIVIREAEIQICKRVNTLAWKLLATSSSVPKSSVPNEEIEAPELK